MKPFKLIASIVGVLVVLCVVGSIPAPAQEKGISSDKLELKLLWSKQYKEDVGFMMTDDGRVVLILPFKEGNEIVGTEIQFIDERGKLVKRFHAKKEERVEGPSYMKRLWFNGMSRNGRYFLFRSFFSQAAEGPKKYSY